MKKWFLVMVMLLGLANIAVAQERTFNEAPMLAELVASGALPPVEERLPPEPLVVEPVEQIGEYGGTWRMLDANNNLDWTRLTAYVEPFLKWKRDASGFRPNLVESWEWNADATEVVVNFRQGIRWSDGDPLTVDDYLFWWNDMVLNPDVPLNPPSGTTVLGEPMTVEKIDDYTLRFSFPAPNPLFLELHSRGSYHSSWFVVPEHYLRQFHPAYNSQITGTTELMNRYNTSTRLHYTDMPVFGPWRPVEFVIDQLLVLERNPYYWKVDPEGNQLPYIDRIQVEIATGVPSQQVVLKALSGQLDMQVRDVALQDVPLVLENAEAGGYRVILWNRGDFAWPWLMLMYDYPDEGIVDLMYTQEFRRALSHAIDRDRINQVVALGLAQPRQFALSAESGEFQTEEGQRVYQEWVNSYIEYDPALAGSLLDEIGVVDVDGDGFRERPDGTSLELIVDIPATDTKSVSTMELVKEDWEAVGLRTVLNVVDGSIVNERAAAGQVMIRAWGSAAAWGLLSAPNVWAPVEGFSWTIGGQRIGQYYVSGGAQGVPPRPGSMLERLQEAYSRIIVEPDPAERDRLLLEAYRIHIEEGPITIGTIGEHPSPVIIANNFHNVPENGLVASHDLAYPGTVDPEQFFISQDN